MHTIQITIQRQTNGIWPVVAEQTAPGQFLPIRIEGALQLDIETLRTQPTPLAYGAALGQSLFSGKIHNTFLQALAASGNALRLLLCVEAEELKALHWQLLCGPLDGDWSFLIQNHRTLYSLYLPAVTDRRFPPIGRRDLRALVLVACPPGLEEYSLTPFDVAKTVAHLRRAFGAIPCDILADTADSVGPATLDAFCTRIVAERYSLVHLVCHGVYSRGQQQSSLFLSNAQGQIDRVSTERLLQRLSQLDSAAGLPHLAFLAACDTAAPDAEDAFGGLAQRLVRQLGMPAVIAMTDRVTLDTATELAAAFYARLVVHGEVDRALTEAATALAERGDILVPALFGRLGDRPLFTQSGDLPLTAIEINAGLDQLLRLLVQLAPVLLPRAQALVPQIQLPQVQSQAVPSSGSLPTVIEAERKQALTELDLLCLDAFALDFRTIAQGQLPRLGDGRCPFRGLASFQVEDRDFFFGRESLVAQLTQRLRNEGFLALVGDSGCGKSSLALAGLAPALQKQSEDLSLLVMTPSRQPLQTLQTLLGSSSPRAGGVLLIVDQGEELFTLVSNAEERDSFCTALVDLIQQGQHEGAPLFVLLTLRVEYLGEAARHAGLRDLLQRHQALIAPMNQSELRSAMEQQANAVGLRFEADLAYTMLDDVAGEPGAMPLLQHALLELWKRRHGRWLRAEEYRNMGGVKRAIAGTANDFYGSLSAVDQARTERLFLRLVRLDPGAEQRDTRRRARLDELARNAGERAASEVLIAQLANARLLVTSVNPVNGRQEVELAHEILIQAWERLQEWIRRDRTGHLVRQRLSEDAQVWAQKGKKVDYLYRGEQLATALQWQTAHPDDLTQLETAFLTAGQQQNQRASLRRMVILAALLLLPAIVASALLFVFQIGPFAPAQIHWTAPAADQAKLISDLVLGDGGRVLSAGMTAAEIGTTDDGGATWTTHQLNGQAIEDMAVDPQNPKVIYAVVSDGGIQRSEDNGNSWQPIPQDLRNSHPTYVTVASDSALYASGSDVAVLRSIDRGVTWTPLDATPPMTVTQLVWGQAGLLVGTEEGLWRWALGAGWQQILLPSAGYIYALATDEQILYAGAQSGLWRIQADQTQKMSEMVVTEIGRMPGPMPLFVAGTNAGSLIWWKGNGALGQEIRLGEQVNFISSLVVDPAQPERLYVGTLFGIYRGDTQAWLAENQ